MSYLNWANGRCSGSWGSPSHAWLTTMNWWFMPSAGPHASHIRHCPRSINPPETRHGVLGITYISEAPIWRVWAPGTSIVSIYCISILETVISLAAIWSKSLIVYASNCAIFLQEIPELKGHLSDIGKSTGPLSSTGENGGGPTKILIVPVLLSSKKFLWGAPLWGL